MKTYNTIDYYGKYESLPIYAFDKLDGSNLRFEYSRKHKQFVKYGTRNVMIDEKSEPFGFAIKLFKDKYEDKLVKLFTAHKDYREIDSIVCFAELIGTNSAFGQHQFETDTFDIVLFDVHLHKKGLIEPKQFISDFEKFGIPKLIYQGNLNQEFINNVKMNKYNLTEGVICKGKIPNRKGDNLYYCKIKTNDWFDRLRNIDKTLFDLEYKQLNLINDNTY